MGGLGGDYSTPRAIPRAQKDIARTVASICNDIVTSYIRHISSTIGTVSIVLGFTACNLFGASDIAVTTRADKCILVVHFCQGIASPQQQK